MKLGKHDCDIIIVGYGPVGAVLANLLGQHGLEVAVFERMADIYDKPRAINIDHEVMRLLQSVGLAEAVDRISSLHTGTEFRGCDGELIKFFRKPEPPFPLHWAPNLMFVQPEFEPLLRQGAGRHATVEVHLAHEAVAVKPDADGVTVEVLDLQNGVRRQKRSKFLIACDGATSPVRKQLNVTQDSLDFDEWWTVVDAWVSAPEKLPARTTQFCLPSGPITYVVGPRNLRRWEIKVLPHENPQDHGDPSLVRERLRQFADPDTIDLWRVATYRFHALVAHQWRLGRVFLAGDAAHQMPPFMAQGLCSGLRDAANLAWKLAGVLDGDYPESLLDTYETERKPHITQLVRITKELGEIIGELDPVRARERDERLRADMGNGRAETVRQRLIPDLTAGLIDLDTDGRPRPAAGALFPQPEVMTAGGAGLLDDVLGPGFAVVVRGRDTLQWLTASPFLDRRDVKQLCLVEDAPGAAAVPEMRETGSLLAEWLGRWGCRAVVVRPDKYVFGVADSAADLHALLAKLEASLRP